MKESELEKIASPDCLSTPQLPLHVCIYQKSRHY